MKPSEKAILDVLRKSTLAYLTDVEFAGIEKAVERDGILNLTGVSKSVLVEAVQKHQEHDQSSHGAWAGTGGGVDSMTQTSLDRGKKALEGRDYKAMMRDYDKMEAKWRKKLDKPFDPEGAEEYGDPQDLATTDFYRKYGAFPTDVQLYAEALPATLKKNSEVTKHGSHDQASHGAWANGKYNPDDSEGEDSPEPKNDRPYPKFPNTKDDSEGEFEELDADDPRWMDDMDIMRPSRITPSQRYTN